MTPHVMGNTELPWLKTCVKEKMEPREVMKSIVEGIEAGQRDFNIKVRLIICTTKEEPSG